MKRLFKTIIAGISAAALALTSIPGTPLAIESVWAEPTSPGTLTYDGNSNNTYSPIMTGIAEGAQSGGTFSIPETTGVSIDSSSGVITVTSALEASSVIVTFTPSDAANYTTTSTTVSLVYVPTTLGASDLTASLDGTLTYNGQPQTPTITLTGKSDKGTAANSALNAEGKTTFQFMRVKDGAENTVTGAQKEYTVKDAGTYEIYATTTAAGYTIDDVALGGLVVARADLSISSLTGLTYSSEHLNVGDILDCSDEPTIDGLVAGSTADLTFTVKELGSINEKGNYEGTVSVDWTVSNIKYNGVSTQSNYDTISGTLSECTVRKGLPTVTSITASCDGNNRIVFDDVGEQNTKTLTVVIHGTNMRNSDITDDLTFSYDEEEVVVGEGQSSPGFNEDATTFTVTFPVTMRTKTISSLITITSGFDPTVSTGIGAVYSGYDMQSHGTLTLSGTPRVGQKLTATWTPTDNYYENSGDTLVWKWERNSIRENWWNAEEIEGATTNEYTLTNADAGKFVRAVYYVEGTSFGGIGADTTSKVTKPTPAPSDPTPSDPTPSDPTPSDPTPVDPTPVDPTPVDPTPVDPTPEPTPEEPAIPTPEDPSADKTPAGEPTTNTETDSSTGAVITTIVQENTDGSTTTTTNTILLDGNVVDTVLVTEENGEYSATTVTTDAEGKVIETVVESQVFTADGDTATTTQVTNEEGTSLTQSIDKADSDDYTTSTEVRDKDGNVVLFTEASRETAADNTITEKSLEKKDGVTTENALVTSPDKSTLQSLTVTDANGAVDSKSESKDSSGTTTGLSFSKKDSTGAGTEESYSVAEGVASVNNITATDGEIVIPGEVESLDGTKIPVKVIEAESVQGGVFVEIPENIGLVETDAFKNSTATTIQVDGTISNHRFAKDCFKPRIDLPRFIATEKGKKKPGKGITVVVENKKAVKAMKKCLKKAGIKGAEVTKQGYRLR